MKPKREQLENAIKGLREAHAVWAQEPWHITPSEEMIEAMYACYDAAGLKMPEAYQGRERHDTRSSARDS